MPNIKKTYRLLGLTFHRVGGEVYAGVDSYGGERMRLSQQDLDWAVSEGHATLSATLEVECTIHADAKGFLTSVTTDVNADDEHIRKMLADKRSLPVKVTFELPMERGC